MSDTPTGQARSGRASLDPDEARILSHRGAAARRARRDRLAAERLDARARALSERASELRQRAAADLEAHGVGTPLALR